MGEAGPGQTVATEVVMGNNETFVPAQILEIAVPPVGLPGTLAVPDEAIAVVIFAHGSGSSRLSPRNAAVAETLRRAGLATLLFDLLTAEEAMDRANVFNIPLLAQRLEAAVGVVQSQAETATLPVEFFGASTGAAAALVAAAHESADIAAVVSRGGRPDLADAALPRVKAPTLLIVGGADTTVLELNHQARAKMTCETDLKIVPGASHLFEEPGTLEEVARLAADWFMLHARRPGHA